MVSHPEGSLSENIKRLRQSIQDIPFILVSKTVPADRIREAYEEGVRDFGENRVQELLAKKSRLPQDIRWHMIGHLQTNKVRQVLGEVVLIQSLDRVELLKEIENQADKKGLAQVDCLIQVKTSREESKHGLPAGEVADFAAGISPGSCVKIHGLMTVAPWTEDSGLIRGAFQALRKLKEDLEQRVPQHSWKTLSMGMSGDYRIAIEEGANLLRIGSLVFGSRSV